MKAETAIIHHLFGEDAPLQEEKDKLLAQYPYLTHLHWLEAKANRNDKGVFRKAGVYTFYPAILQYYLNNTTAIFAEEEPKKSEIISEIPETPKSEIPETSISTESSGVPEVLEKPEPSETAETDGDPTETSISADSPDVPEALEKPEPSETSETVETSETAETSETFEPSISAESLDVPNAFEKPEPSETIETSEPAETDGDPTETSETSETTETSISTESPDVPEALEKPESSETVETPETSETVETAETVETSETPETLKTSKTPIFQPLYTEDYFAYTRTKLPENIEDDKPPTMEQVKSFTGWLRMMKTPVAKARQIEDEELIPNELDQDGSLNEAEVVTESMAEIWIKHGQLGKAKTIYEKLILLNPEKKGYFAVKISRLKEQ